MHPSENHHLGLQCPSALWNFTASSIALIRFSGLPVFRFLVTTLRLLVFVQQNNIIIHSEPYKSLSLSLLVGLSLLREISDSHQLHYVHQANHWLRMTFDAEGNFFFADSKNDVVKLQAGKQNNLNL